jgi:hypothetical protein
MPFGVAAAAVSAAAGVAGSMMQGSAQEKAAGQAADAQVQSNRDSISAQERALASANTLMRPWENAGYSAQQQLSYLMGLGGNSLKAKPLIGNYKKTDQYGNEYTDNAGYQNDLAHWRNDVQRLTGIEAPQRAAFRKPVYDNSGKLTGYKLDRKAFKEARLGFEGQLSNYYQQQQKGNAPGGGQQGGEYGSLMQDYTPEQYKEDPGYTPMVNDLASLQATPGYQFREQQGEQAVNRGAAARGGLLSGATQKALTEFGQGLASTEFQNAWQRAQTAYQAAFDRYNQNRTTKYNMLSTQAGRGQNAANTMAGAATNAGNNISQIQQNTGNALSGLYMQNGNNQADMWGNMANQVNQLAGNVYTAGRQNGWWGNGGAQTTPQGWGPTNPTTQVG